MTTNVFIDGEAGTTGLQIQERLAPRADISLIQLGDDARKDARARRDALNAADVAILCLPDDAARESVSMIDSDTAVIDASTAHRAVEGWDYGFPEYTARSSGGYARIQTDQQSRLLCDHVGGDVTPAGLARTVAGGLSGHD